MPKKHPYTRPNPRHAPQRDYKRTRIEALEKRFGKPIRQIILDLHPKLGTQKKVAEHLGYSQGGMSVIYRREKIPVRFVPQSTITP